MSKTVNRVATKIIVECKVINKENDVIEDMTVEVIGVAANNPKFEEAINEAVGSVTNGTCEMYKVLNISAPVLYRYTMSARQFYEMAASTPVV